MSPVEKMAIMAFGAALAITGVILFARAKGQSEGTNKIKLAKIEFEFGAPSLFIFLIGCGLFVLPFFISDAAKPLAVETATLQPTPAGPVTALGTAVAPDAPDAPTALRQAELEARLAEMQRRLDDAQRANLGAESTRPQTEARVTAALPDISGQWTSPSGSYYVVQQLGDEVAIQEITGGMISAVGEGSFDGRTLDASFQTLVGDVDVSLNLSGDHRRLAGELTHALTGGTTPFEMQR